MKVEIWVRFNTGEIVFVRHAVVVVVVAVAVAVAVAAAAADGVVVSLWQFSFGWEALA